MRRRWWTRDGKKRSDSGFSAKTLRATLHGLVARLAKLSIKDGGKEAALCLHRYLTAGANGTVPAHEITVVHGLVVKTRSDLNAGAYLAPYVEARAEFGLPDEPETMSKMSYPDAAVLVRSIEYGPGIAPPDDDYGLPVCANFLPLPCRTLDRP